MELENFIVVRNNQIGGFIGKRGDLWCELFFHKFAFCRCFKVPFTTG